ncbi:MAG: imidazoleglycerol-phosphate dehydratase [Euryarchaeota archaeon]|nr:imidazoleglycerol-phosphate dehydratase [Euryarchaeota archaeon]
MGGRKAKVSRKTRETEVEISLVLDGSGKGEVRCEEQFLKHMLETLAKYASFDFQLRIKGDDMHHVIEDAAIVLGTAVKEAVGDAPIERVAHATVPMDDALVACAVDMIDRPYVDVDCPDDLYLHFFRSFAMSSGITLHIVVERGFDDHHIIEAAFKSLGLSLRKAVVPRASILSTKEKPRIRRE